MAIQQPISTDPLNSPAHSKLHRVVAVDVAADDESLYVDSASNTVVKNKIKNSAGTRQFTPRTVVRNELNIMLFAFQLSVADSLLKYNLVGGMIDEYEDESGIDSVNSAYNSYNSAGVYYSPELQGIDSDTKLMLHFDGFTGAKEIVDSSYGEHIVTQVATAALQTTTKKIGSSALFLDGNSDYLSIPDNPDWDLGTGDFTLECWAYWTVLPPSGTGSADRLINHGLELSNSLGEWEFAIAENGGGGYCNIRLNIRQASSWYNYNSSTFLMTTGVWYHIAVVRSGTTIYGFLNGVQQGSTGTSADTLTSATSMALTVGAGGTDDPSGTYLNGYMDEVRISNTARWTTTFTPETSAYTSDQYTKLLLHMETLDVSPSYHIPTFVGTAQLSKNARKFSDAASYYFNGSGSAPISIPDSGDWEITDYTDYTVDFWVKHTSVPSVTERYFYQWQSDTERWGMHGNSSGVRFILSSGGQSEYIATPAASPILDTNWHHIALCKVGNLYGVYKDGVQIGYTSSANTANRVASLYLGNDGNSVDYFTGYMQDFRITTANSFSALPNATPNNTITVPSVAHTPDSNTVLLMHGNGQDGGKEIVDATNPGHVVTQNGTAQLSTVDKKIGSTSLLLDGNSDYLTIPDSDDWDLGTGDMTIDFWVNFSGLPGSGDQNSIINHWDKASVSAGAWDVVIVNAASVYTIRLIIKTGGETQVSETITPSTGTWYHYAIVRSSGTVHIYEDGTELGTGTATSDTMSGEVINLTIGRHNNSSHYFYGYLDEVRISDNARWTEAFTPSTTAYTSDANTLLLLHMDTQDVSGDGGSDAYHIPTFTNAVLETNYARFSDNASLLLDGNSDYVSIPDSADWNLGTGDFTVDCWVNFNSVSGTQYFASQWVSGNNFWGLKTESSKFYFSSYTSASADVVISVPWVPVINTWYHLAVVRSGSTVNDWFLFIDGVAGTKTLEDGAYTGTIPDLAIPLYIGWVGTGTTYMNGYIDEMRISKGIARWTADFIPLTSEYSATPYNMVLQSVLTEAVTTPDDSRIVIFEEDVDTITLNTDLLAYASRDNGTTWSQITLADEGEYESGKRILTGIADISSQPAVSTYEMVYKLETANNKDLKIHGVALNW